MAAKSQPESAQPSTDQQRCLEEWRHLCFTLERAQGENLVQNCHDKFQFAKTYLIYGRDLEQTVAEIKHSAAQGNFRFFSDRGIRSELLTAVMIDQMLRDWRGAIASKKALVADVFQKRFGEDIDHFVATPHNAMRLFMAASYDESDAIAGLADWTHTRLAAAEIGQLRSDLSQLKAQIDHLGETVHGQLTELLKRVEALAKG